MKNKAELNFHENPIKKFYYPTRFAGISFPASRQKSNFFKRTNGKDSFYLESGSWENPNTGKTEYLPLPYGIIPRQTLAFLGKVYHNNLKQGKENPRIIDLGDNLFSFLTAINSSVGGKTYKSIMKQLDALFRCRIMVINADVSYKLTSQNHFADKIKLWWDHKRPTQPNLFTSEIEISEIVSIFLLKMMPLDLEVIKKIGGNCLEFDIYCWLNIRHYAFKGVHRINWEKLHEQFGANYKVLRDFKKMFIKAFNNVYSLYYHQSKLTPEGVLLKYSDTHIKPRNFSRVKAEQNKKYLRELGL